MTATINPLTTAEAIPFLDLVAQHRGLEDELVNAFRRALQSATFIGGPEVQHFEEEFAAFVGAPHAVAVNSGTDALRFAYMAYGVRPGDEVITVAHTFIATTEAVTQAGARFRFVDVDDSTMTLDPAHLESAITERTVGVIPVHLYGHPANMDAIKRIADLHRLWIVEDAAQAHGALYKGRPCGSLAPMAAFSFYPGKNLGACGEGGAVTGIEPERIETVRRLRDHGQGRKYYHDSEGYNGRLDAIQAAILRIKLRHLEEWTEKRRRAADLYEQALEGIGEIRLPDEAPEARHVYHLYVIRAERRDDLQRYLAERRIATGLHYPVPLHLQRAYAHLGFGRGMLPTTERCADTVLSLPMFPEITESQIVRVGETIRGFYRGASPRPRGGDSVRRA